MEARIRKTIVYIEDVLIEGGRAAPRPYRAVAAAAVIANPWAGQGFVEDLRPGINAIAPLLGSLLVPMLLDAAPAGEVEAYGKAASVGTNGAPGCAIDVPMKHRTAEGTRSHLLTISFVIPDAPGADEIVVALGVATSGRPHARIGDRYEDMKELGVDQTGSRAKAAV